MVGVSGGIDSCVLLHTLVEAGWKPIVLHFDHGWRRTSSRDAEFIKKLSKKYGLECYIDKDNSIPIKKEGVARDLRWNFFKKAAKRYRCLTLVLAHHANDQVETFLWQMMRGTGSAWKGMEPVSRREELTVYRPLLSVWRSEIEAYAKAAKLTWREDITNADIAYSRNRIRHRLIPFLEKEFSPGVSRRLWNLAEILRGESAWMDLLCRPEAGQPELTVKDLRAFPMGQRRRIIRLWLERQGIRDISFADIELVNGLVERVKPAKVNLSGACHARRREGKIFVEKPRAGKKAPTVAKGKIA